MYQMMYKTEGLSPTYMDVCKTKESKEEFLKNRELLARGMDLYKARGDTLILYTKNEEFGRYYVDNFSTGSGNHHGVDSMVNLW